MRSRARIKENYFLRVAREHGFAARVDELVVDVLGSDVIRIADRVIIRYGFEIGKVVIVIARRADLEGEPRFVLLLGGSRFVFRLRRLLPSAARVLGLAVTVLRAFGTIAREVPGLVALVALLSLPSPSASLPLAVAGLLVCRQRAFPTLGF